MLSGNEANGSSAARAARTNCVAKRQWEKMDTDTMKSRHVTAFASPMPMTESGNVCTVRKSTIGDSLASTATIAMTTLMVACLLAERDVESATVQADSRASSSSSDGVAKLLPSEAAHHVWSARRRFACGHALNTPNSVHYFVQYHDTCFNLTVIATHWIYGLRHEDASGKNERCVAHSRTAHADDGVDVGSRAGRAAGLIDGVRASRAAANSICEPSEPRGNS